MTIQRVVFVKVYEQLWELLHTNGYLVCIATGRGLYQIPQSVLDIYPWDYYVCYNGQCVYDKDLHAVLLQPIDSHAVQTCIEIANRTNTPLDYKVEKTCYVANYKNEAFEQACTFLNVQRWPIKPYAIEKDVVFSMMVYRENGEYEDFTDIPGVAMFPSVHSYADLNLEGSSKYKGIQYVLEKEGLSSYVAIGDADNDLEMLEHASISICMGNGTKAAKEKSDYVTAATYEDGILQAAKWLLEQE